MTKPIMKRVYQVTLKCSQINKGVTVHGDKETNGMKFLNDTFYLTMEGLKRFNSKYKSRSIEIELISEE